MNKAEAISLIGKTQADLARALDVTRQCIHKWPDPLDTPQVDRIVGAAIRLGKLKLRTKSPYRKEDRAA